MSLKYVTLTILAVLSVMGVTGAYAQEIQGPAEGIIVQTDKSSYSEGDIIKITGGVYPLSKYSQSVTILVIDPDGNNKAIIQVMPSSDGRFSHTMKAGGTMNVSGDYEVHAQYGAQKVTSTFIFTADGSIFAPEPTPEPNSLCGVGTYYDSTTNSCKLDYTNPNSNYLTNQIIQLKNTIIFLEDEIDGLHDDVFQLNVENNKLKNQINTLQEKLENLQNIINEQIKVMMDMFIEMKNG